MDENLIIGNSLTEFITKLKRAGVEVKHGQQFSFRPPGSKRFFRQDSLGEDYSYEAILERLSGKRTVTQKKFVAFKITKETKFSLLIDIQQKIQEGKGEAYENWARIYNLKQATRTLIYLQEQGIDSYDDLVKKCSAATANSKTGAWNWSWRETMWNASSESTATYRNEPPNTRKILTNDDPAAGL